MRDRLLQILAEGLPEGVLKTGREVVGVSQSSAGATVRFRDGSEAGPFDLVVGADGVRGASREIVRGGGVGGPLARGAGAIYSGIRIQFGVAPGGQRPPG